MSTFNEAVANLVSEGYARPQIYSILQHQFPELSYECIRSRVRRFNNGSSIKVVPQRVEKQPIIEEQEDEFTPKTTSVEYRKDGTVTFERVIQLAKDEELSPYNILKAHGMSPEKWEILSYKNNLWQSQKKGGDILNLYQSKITAKPIKESISLEDIKKHFDTFSRAFTLEPVSKYEKNDRQILMYEINICDLHLGRFCYDNETGEPVSTEITKERYFKVIDAECERISKIAKNLNSIVFVWSNDFFNSDGISKATTGGTPQDTDKKWQELYLIGIEMLVETIERLKQYASVTTFYIASNHSRQTDFYAINYLAAWFRNDNFVSVKVNASPRQYIEFGANLIGFAHGYYEKKDQLPFLMSNECPEEWARTKYREFHLAHIHSEKVEEKGGIVFRWLPSVTSADTWSKECGYCMSTKRSYSFIYDWDKGLIQINSTTVD